MAAPERELHTRQNRPAPRQEGLRWRSMWRATFRGECPNCVFGKLFDGVFTPREHCATCGMTFEPDGSNWLGTSFLVLMVASLVLTAEGVTLGLVFGLFPGFAWVLAASTVAVVALSFRPCRGWWVWCLWALGDL